MLSFTIEASCRESSDSLSDYSSLSISASYSSRSKSSFDCKVGFDSFYKRVDSSSIFPCVPKFIGTFKNFIIVIITVLTIK